MIIHEDGTPWTRAERTELAWLLAVMALVMLMTLGAFAALQPKGDTDDCDRPGHRIYP